MTEPTTPTGRRLWDHPDVRADLLGGITGGDVLAIEAEAAQQERERLRHAAVTNGLPRWSDLTLADVQALLADPAIREQDDE